MLGSILVAMSSAQLRSLAFAIWIVANVCWLNDARVRKDREQLILYMFFTITSLLGFYTNIMEILA